MKIYFKSKNITDRSTYDQSAMEGGALNANYQDLEASLYISHRLGAAGYRYKDDFYFITCSLGSVVLEFYNEECASVATILFSDAIYSN
jgi:hypothetical protein